MMLSKREFINEVIRVAREQGYKIEISARNGMEQIDFGNKKLHAGHLEDLYPAILGPDAHIPTLIDKVAPGRPCSHRPLREIMEQLRREGKC